MGPRGEGSRRPAIARPGVPVLDRDRSGRRDGDAREPTSAGGMDRHRCSRGPETTTARERAEVAKAEEGLTPKLSRAEGVGLNDQLANYAKWSAVVNVAKLPCDYLVQLRNAVNNKWCEDESV
jgi:hypothetical protein